MPVIPFPGAAPMPPGADGWCGWELNPENLCSDFATYTEAQQNAAMSMATMIVWANTGRQFGPCEITIRPCQTKDWAEQYRAFPVWWTSGEWGGPMPFLYAGQWRNCGCGGGCCCKPRCEISLDGPVASIEEVLVHGVVVSPTEYRVDVAYGGYHLVRTAGGCWPVCQDFNEPGDGADAFSVKYTRGRPVPGAVIYATELLACEMGKAIVNAPCALPARLSSLTRQGVTADFVATQSEMDIGIFPTGINEVDMIIRAVNPSRRTRPPVVLSPDLPGAFDRMTIIGGP
jgi:hypothetical protein